MGLSAILKPHKELVGGVASYLTVLLYFSGIDICRDIQQRGNTTHISCIPFVGGAVMGLASVKYGMILNDKTLIQVNTVAIILNLVYICFFYAYTTDKWNEFYKPLAIATAIVAMFWGYAEFEDPKKLEIRFGIIVTIIMLAILAAPLADIKEILEKKDASKIPFVLTFMGALVTFSWMLYAIILENGFMIFQHSLAFILCGVRMLLIILYPGVPLGGIYITLD